MLSKDAVGAVVVEVAIKAYLQSTVQAGTQGSRIFTSNQSSESDMACRSSAGEPLPLTSYRDITPIFMAAS